MMNHPFRIALLSCVLLAAGVACWADGGNRDDVRRDLGLSDLQLLQGKWELTAFEYHLQGQVSKADPKQMKGEKWHKDNGYRLKLDVFGFQVDRNYTIKLFPEKTPKEYDVTFPDGTKVSGIYELKGDVLRQSYSAPGIPRPKKFQVNGQTYQVWKRARVKKIK